MVAVALVTLVSYGLLKLFEFCLCEQDKVAFWIFFKIG